MTKKKNQIHCRWPLTSSFLLRPHSYRYTGPIVNTILANSLTLALTASLRGSAALAAMPFIDDDLLWCPDNDGRMVDMSQVCLDDGMGNQLPAMAALQQQVQQQQLLHAQQLHQLQMHQHQTELPNSSTDLNSINPTIEPDDLLGQLELENLFQDFPVSIADIKEENNNDMSGVDEGPEYISIESPSSSDAAAVMLQTQHQLLGLQVLLQQQQQQQQHNHQHQNNHHRFSIAANPLLAEKLMSPNLAANLTNLDSLVNGSRGRPPDNKGKCASERFFPWWYNWWNSKNKMHFRLFTFLFYKENENLWTGCLSFYTVLFTFKKAEEYSKFESKWGLFGA